MSAYPQTAAPVVVVVGGPVTSSVKLTGKTFHNATVPSTLPFELNGIMTQDEYLNTIVTPINNILTQSKASKFYRIGLIFTLISIFPLMALSLLFSLGALVSGFVSFSLFIVFAVLAIVFLVKSSSQKKRAMNMVINKANEISTVLAPRGFNVRIEEQSSAKYVEYFLKICYNPNMASGVARVVPPVVAPVIAPAATIPYTGESVPLMTGAVYPTTQ